MAADKKAIDLGKIKRYIKNRTAEFFVETLEASDRDKFKEILNYLNNIRKTKDLAPEFDTAEIERIKAVLTNFSPTNEQYKIINAINKQKRNENVKTRKTRKKPVQKAAPVVEKTVFEKISLAFWDMKTFLEEEGKTLSAKELELIRKNMILLTNYVDQLHQERVKIEIQQAQKQAEEIKARIERLNSKIKAQGHL
jgi:hypothetical protein